MKEFRRNWKKYPEEMCKIDERMECAEELIVIASGSSYNAAFMAKLFLEETCGIRTTLFYPNVFVNYHTDIQKKAAYLFISQGGQTKLVYEAMLIGEKGRMLYLCYDSR